MAIIPYRPVRGYGATLNGDAQLEDVELQDADLTQPGVVLRGPGARELAARVHESGGTEAALDPEGGQALFWRPDGAGDELCMVHEDTLYTSKPTEITANGTQAWRRVGTWAPWTLRETILHQPLNYVWDMDVATIQDAATGKTYHVGVWEQQATVVFGQPAAPGVYAIVVDESGGLVAPPAQLASGTNSVNPRACACDTGVVILWADTTTAMWNASAWRLSNPIEFVAATGVVAGTVGTAPLHDLRKDGPDDRVIAVFTDTVAPFNVSIRRITVSLGVTSLGGFAVAQAPSTGISVDVDPLGGYLIAWANATNANAVHVNAAGVVDTAIATLATANPIVRITGCHVDGVASQGTIAVEQRVGGASDYRNYVEVFDYDGAVLTSLREQRGAIIWGHALIFAGRPMAWLEHYVSNREQEGAQLLSDLRTGDVYARAFSIGLGGRDLKCTLYNQPSTPHIVGGALFHGAALVRATTTSLDPTVQILPDSLAVSRVDPAAAPRNPATAPGYVMDAHAGFPVVLDGAEGVEADWHALPAINTAAAAGGGGLTPSTTYTVAVTYRWVPRNGDFWRAAPHTVAVSLGGAQGTINLDLVPCRWTARALVLIEVWISEPNQGSPLNLHTVIVSDPSVDSQLLSITSTAAAAAAGITLDQFEPDAVLGHGRTQVTDFMAYVLGRFWSPDPLRSDILRYTIERDISRDGFGWGWEATQLVQLDTSVRPQAAGELEGTLAVLAGNECHLLAGLGPDKQGAGLFGQPSKFGVVDLETSQAKLARVPDSAVPGGLAYATPRGLYLLRRDRVAQHLSAQVSRLFRFDGVVPQAVAYAPEFGEVWLMTLTAEARSLRFSLLTGRWCADSARRAQDVSVSPRGDVAWLLPGARVRLLDETLIADGDDDLVFRGETPAIRIADNVSQTVNVQALMLHVHVLTAPATLDIAIVDVRTGSVVALNQQTFASAGRQSRSVHMINLPTYGHRIQWSQPAGDTGAIVIVEMDHQADPADGVIARTATPL